MQQPSRTTFFVLYTIICLIWGSTWLVIHLGNSSAMPPFAAAALRFTVASSLLWGFVATKNISVPKTKQQWLATLSVGLLSNGASFGIVYATSLYVPSGLGAVIFGTMPLFTAAFAHYYIPGDHLTRTRVTGIVIGVLGIATIFLPQFSQVKVEGLWAMGLLLIAPIVSAASAIVTKRGTHDVPAVTVNAITTAVGALVLGVIALFTEPIDKIDLSWSQLWPILYLAILGTIVTFGIYFKLIKITSAVTMSYVSVITPAIAVFLGWIILGEKLDAYEISGSALVLIGTAISLRM
ncbi:MAG: EamA family transporter [Bacteroidetes bacterium]|nr:EamA family transporter [Bacteroidota bacterium]